MITSTRKLKTDGRNLTFRDGHHTMLVAVMQKAASDWAASRLAVAIELVPAALVESVEEPPIMPAPEPLRVQPETT